MQRIHNQLPALKDLSAHNAAKSGDSIAFEDATESVTWAEFEERSRKAANVFSEYVSKGDRIALFSKPSVEHATLFNGALKAGAVTTNLHKRIAPGSFRECLDRTKPTIAVIDSELSESFAEMVDQEQLDRLTAVFSTGDPQQEFETGLSEKLAAAEPEAPDVLVEEDDIVTIAWTSGSTGHPKGWCHTNRTMFLKGMELGTRSGFSRSDKQLVVNRPSFLIWTSFLTRSLLGCESTYYMREWDPERWLEVVDEHDITRAVLVPTMWKEILESGPEEYDLDSLRSINSTGEKLSPDTLSELRDRICENINQSYGSTEIHSTVLYNNELTEERIESVGKPQSGTQVRILDPDGTIEDTLPPNESGEIAVKSYQAPAWMWEDERGEAAFEDGWWRSGDKGSLDEEGFLYIEGRIDFQIKSKGVKVTPEPIEEALERHPDVTNAAVVGVDDEEYGQKVTAIVEGSAEVTEEALDAWIRESDSVASHERPREYYFVKAIDRTPSGKLDRQGTKARLDLD
ncbi:class I adenylate-forming enzyme family protein [Halobellus salinisoli]|uniref:class I adenylate-forming enzyme family protein n=1 Tax=Halobellus salinisoli TaxID=3108500 RepID=UPI00300B2BE0